MLATQRPVSVGGVTFAVHTPWGVMRRFTERLAEIEATEMGERAREAAVEAATRELLAQVVVGWEGVEDETGRPVPWDPARLDELETAAVAELVRKLAEPPGDVVPGKDPSG